TQIQNIQLKLNGRKHFEIFLNNRADATDPDIFRMRQNRFLLAFSTTKDNQAWIIDAGKLSAIHPIPRAHGFLLCRRTIWLANPVFSLMSITTPQSWTSFLATSKRTGRLVKNRSII